MNFIWESILVAVAGIILLRLSGRKSVSQMTLATTVVMLSIGTIIVQPVLQSSLSGTVLLAALFIGTLVLFEYLQLKFNFLEKLITGKSVVLIENGYLNVQMLKRVRLSVDQLEMRLREKGISKIDDLKTATLEPNGQLGYELKDEVRPLTVRDFEKMMSLYMQKSNREAPAKTNIFAEVTQVQDSPEHGKLQ
jgi:uncharacterized membrane protein YcaP (DUF421 family)